MVGDAYGGLTLERARPQDPRELVLAGALDLAGVPQLRDALATAEARGGDVVLCVGDLSFVDSSGLSVMVAAARRLRLAGDRLVLRAPCDRLRRLIEIAHLEDLFVVE